MIKSKIAELWPLDRHGNHMLLAGTVLFFAFVFIIGLKEVFTPFFTSLLIAYILNPILNAGEKFSIPRWLSTCLIFFTIALFSLIFALISIPSFISEFQALSHQSQIFSTSPEKFVNTFREMAEKRLSPEMIERGSQLLRNWWMDLRESETFFRSLSFDIGHRLLIEIQRIPGLMIYSILIPFYLFFLMNSLNNIWDFTEKYLFPYEYRSQLVRISEKIHKSLSSFFRGRFLISILVGCITWFGLVVLGVPFPFLFGMAIGFATFIPLLGLFFLVPAGILFVVSGADVMEVVYLLLFYSVIQSIEMFVLTPIILGKEVELPPVVLVLALFIFGHLFGVIGVILAVPITSTCKILFSEFIFPSFVELSKRRSDFPVS